MSDSLGAPAISTERMQLSQFLSALWPAGFDEQWCLFWGAPSKRSMWVQTISEELLDHLLTWAQTEDVYIGCGLRGENLGPHERGTRDTVTAIPGVWIDLDFSCNGHSKQNLPPTQEAALALLTEMGPPPTLLVHSGHGLQAWWVFKEPSLLNSEAERMEAERLTKGWCTMLRAKAKAHGWDADQVGDLPRVMRLPGLWNRKGIPCPTVPLACEGAYWNPSDLDAYLPTALNGKEGSDHRQWLFEPNPLAEPPAEKFAALLDAHHLFKFSWQHARTDLQDQSASSYDLSLATLAFQAGWTGQEIVNLLIAHRRKYGEDLKLRKDYYERTLNRAASGKTTKHELIDGLKAGALLPERATNMNGHASATTPTRAYPCTDVGNAEYFADRYGERVRYDHRRARWLLWQHHRWAPDVDAEVRRLATASVRERYRDASIGDDSKARERLAKWAIQSEMRGRQDALIGLAQSVRPIADAGDSWDRDPMLFCAPNGVIDLRTGSLRPGRQADRITMSAAVPFDAKASCPRWERFVLEIFGDDRELAAFLQRAVGYSLTGDTTEQCLFLLYGVGSNGKSTLVTTMTHLLGDYVVNTPFSTLERQQRASIPNDLAALDGRRFISASETNDGMRLNEARVKALTGCDPITARFLYAENFTFEPVGKLWLCVNHKPIVHDDSHGFWRRIRLIPFLQKFPLDKTLSQELLTEGPGILAWAVRGCLEWQQLNGLHPPKVVTEATATYAKESDPLSEFLEEACRLDSAAEVRAEEVYGAYRAWAMRQGLTHEEWLSGTAFGRKMKTRFQARRTRYGTVYTGVETLAYPGVKKLGV